VTGILRNSDRISGPRCMSSGAHDARDHWGAGSRPEGDWQGTAIVWPSTPNRESSAGPRSRSSSLEVDVRKNEGPQVRNRTVAAASLAIALQRDTEAANSSSASVSRRREGLLFDGRGGCASRPAGGRPVRGTGEDPEAFPKIFAEISNLPGIKINVGEVRPMTG